MRGTAPGEVGRVTEVLGPTPASRTRTASEATGQLRETAKGDCGIAARVGKTRVVAGAAALGADGENRRPGRISRATGVALYRRRQRGKQAAAPPGALDEA